MSSAGQGFPVGDIKGAYAQVLQTLRLQDEQKFRASFVIRQISTLLSVISRAMVVSGSRGGGVAAVAVFLLCSVSASSNPPSQNAPGNGS